MPSRRPVFASCSLLAINGRGGKRDLSLGIHGSALTPSTASSFFFDRAVVAQPSLQFSPVTLCSISPQNQKPRFGSHKKEPTSPVAGPCLVALVVCKTQWEEDLLFEAIVTKLSGTLSFRRRLADHCRVSLFSCVKDISKDGGILKNIITEGEKWDNPKDLDEVFVKYEACLEDGIIISKSDGVEFTVEECYFCPALAKAVKKLKKGEKVLLNVKPQCESNFIYWRMQELSFPFHPSH